MTSDAVLVLRFIFEDILRLFTFRVPGTLTTPLAWAFFVLAVVAVLRLLKGLFHIGGDDDD